MYNQIDNLFEVTNYKLEREDVDGELFAVYKGEFDGIELVVEVEEPNKELSEDELQDRFEELYVWHYESAFEPF